MAGGGRRKELRGDGLRDGWKKGRLHPGGLWSTSLCCRGNCAPEIDLHYDAFDHLKLHTVSWSEIKVHGYKYVTYRMTTPSGTFPLTIKYYVTDCSQPIVSATGLTKAGYTLNFSRRGSSLVTADKLVLHLTTEDGLHYITVSPLRREREDYSEQLSAL